MPLFRKRKKKVNSEPTPSKKRGFFRRLLKVCLFLVAGFLVLITVAYITLRILYPPEKLKNMVVQTVARAVGGELSLGKVKFNIFHGFDFYEVAWQPSEISDTSEVVSLPLGAVKAKRIVLKYQLISLLRRHAHVKSILFDSPEIELRLTELPSDESLLQPIDSIKTIKPAVETLAVQVDSIQLAIPLRISLDEFEIKDAVLHVISDNGQTVQDIFLGNISFRVRDMKVPRGNPLAKTEDVQATVEIKSNNAPFRFNTQSVKNERTSPFGIHGRLNLNIQVDVAGLDDLTLNGSVVIDELELLGLASSDPNFESSYAKITQPVSANIILYADATIGSAVLDTMTLGFGQALQFAAEGNAEQLLTNPNFKLNLTNGKILLADALAIVHEILPAELSTMVKFTNPQAAIYLRDTHASGRISDQGKTQNVSFETSIVFEDVSGDLLNPSATIKDLFILAQVSGRIDSSGLNNLDIDFSTSLSTAIYSLDDTTQIWCGPVKVGVQASLASQLSVIAATCSLTVQDLLGATLAGDITAASAENIAEMRSSGHFTLSELLLSELPNVPIESHANLDLSFALASLDSIGIAVKLTTDSLRLPIEETLQSFPGLSIIMEATAHTDTAFQSFWLDSLTASLNDMVKARASAMAKLGSLVRFSADVHEIRVEHDGLLDWLPPSQKEQLADLKLSGYTILCACLKGQTSADSLTYTLHADVKTHNTHIDYPSKFIAVSGLNLNLTADATHQEGIIGLDVSIDTVRTDNLPGTVFCNNTIHLKASTPDFSNFEFSEGSIEFPDLRARVELNARANGLPAEPYYEADLKFWQSVPDTLEITRSLGIQGDIQLEAHLVMDTSIAAMTGQLETKGVNLFLPEGTRISGVNTDLNFTQSYDLQNNRLLSDGQGLLKIPSATTVDYQLYRSYYNDTLGDFSYLTVDHIKAGGYSMDSLKMDLLVGNARLEIPQFLLNIYGGNFGGSMSLDLSGGDLQEAKYRLSAHLSSVNSALLLPGTATGGEKGLINANMQFVGKGLDPQAGIEIGGHLYITEIGPKVADNFLRSLDPKGTDSGIRTTRLLINRGFKPKLFFFEAKHGYLYPTVTFKQPWYFPLKLSGGKVELPRMPIEFFLQNAMHQREKKG